MDNTSACLGLNIHRGKSKVLKGNTGNTNPITLRDEPFEEVESFTYLGSTINTVGGTDEDVKTRIGKARNAFRQLGNVWRSTTLSTRTKIRMFNTLVKPVLLYESETWRTTNTITGEITDFHQRLSKEVVEDTLA